MILETAQREADRAKKERRSRRGEAENEELNTGRKIRVGGGWQKFRDVRDQRVQSLGGKEKVWVT